MIINGVAQPVRQEKRQVTLPIVPDSQRIQLQWREPNGIQRLFRSPSLNLGTDSVNSEIRIELPRDRWVLLAGGPQLGPAVLFWGALVVVVLVVVVMVLVVVVV